MFITGWSIIEDYQINLNKHPNIRLIQKELIILNFFFQLRYFLFT